MVLNLRELVSGKAQEKTTNIGQYLHERVQTDWDGTEEEKKKKQAKIYAKIQSGARLSAQEMRFVQEYMPEMYPAVLRQQKLREMALHAFENCRSKEEVAQTEQRLYSGISENDPNREMMVAAIVSAKKEFQETGGYKNLPQELPDEKKNQSPTKDQISYEVSENGYQTAYVVETEQERKKLYGQ
ncbi:MAG: hypothetical protein ACI4HI_08940 [Lachnospiraceae bacterium]